MEEAFQEGRLAGLAEAADMAETYAFRKINGGPVQLGMDRSMIIVTQFWLSEHIRARAEERPEPKREPLDPAP
ncbi:hypothetical protein GGR34_003675 [Microvirga flocculans]|uniref:Uncharacterized protein n=1 Tax=Microvirga flocculans TaxID=217168 RepID=A0A7W6II97_9HYPH|nr:hypothetical protein [Microvirga flocculans]MBB4041990.1 hypothetical protein [Microvirga flocculans]